MCVCVATRVKTAIIIQIEWCGACFFQFHDFGLRIREFMIHVLDVETEEKPKIENFPNYTIRRDMGSVI